VGSDWVWELRAPVTAETALRELYARAADRDLSPHRPDGLINLLSKPDADLRTVEDPAAALAAMASGADSGQLWANGDVDIFVDWQDGRLVWALDSVFCHRRPTPDADPFRELHARLTALWLDVAQSLNAEVGRVLDDWSMEQIWAWNLHDAQHPTGTWPAELGWSTYLGPDQHTPAPFLAEVAAGTRTLPNGALVVTLLEDPAAVDVLRYQDLHGRWLQAT
jgi:hypothetical protein